MISVSSSTSSGSGDVGGPDVVVVILGCWFVELDTMLEVGMGIFRSNAVIEAVLCCRCAVEDWGFGVVYLRHVITSTSDAIMQKLGLHGLGLLDY